MRDRAFYVKLSISTCILMVFLLVMFGEGSPYRGFVELVLKWLFVFVCINTTLVVWAEPTSKNKDTHNE